MHLGVYEYPVWVHPGGFIPISHCQQDKLAQFRGGWGHLCTAFRVKSRRDGSVNSNVLGTMTYAEYAGLVTCGKLILAKDCDQGRPRATQAAASHNSVFERPRR